MSGVCSTQLCCRPANAENERFPHPSGGTFGCDLLWFSKFRPRAKTPRKSAPARSQPCVGHGVDVRERNSRLDGKVDVARGKTGVERVRFAEKQRALGRSREL